MRWITGMLLLLSSIFISACGPPQVEKYEDIESNETAFVINLEGRNNDQAKFDSLDAVKGLLVPSKRIIYVQRKKKTGRMYWNYEWINTNKVIKVDRSPVTREWSESNAKNGNRDADAIYVESKESIAFSMAVTITCSIKEENAHKFLYWYGGKSLAQVVDQNVRSVVAAEMAKRFGTMTLNECRESKGTVFDEIGHVVKTEFEDKGITILSFGNSGGLAYEDPKIQDTMNREFVSQNELRVANNMFQADEVKRKNTLADAENERKKAEEFGKAQKAAEARIELEIMKSAVDKWKGDVPKFIVLGQGVKTPDLMMLMPNEVVADE